MRKFRGFKLAKRVTTLCRWITRRRRFIPGYRRLNEDPCKSSSISTISRLCNWGHRLKTTAKTLCFAKPGLDWYPGRDYIRAGQEKRDDVPKGHLAVYVGQDDGDFRRVLVPVIYFNHPLFGELLRETEEEYGFHHPGGITIPCRISKFESVQTRIAAGHGYRKLTWKRHY